MSSVERSNGAAPQSDGSVEYRGVRYLRAPVPIHFPESAEVPESKRHLDVRTLLYLFLKHAFASSAHIGCDQFVYWDHSNPRMCLAPDAFVRWGGPDDAFRSWYVWERGAPQLAVEVLSQRDALSMNRKVLRYAAVGVQELLAFDTELSPGLLRLWQRVDGDLVERKLDGHPARSCVLPGFWLVVETSEGPTLRLSHDAEGQNLYPTEAEANRISSEANKAEAEANRIRAEASEAEAEANRISSEANKAEAEANRIRAEASEAEAEANRIRAEASEAEAAANKAEAEANKAEAEAHKAEAEAHKAEAEAHKARVRELEAELARR